MNEESTTEAQEQVEELVAEASSAAEEATAKATDTGTDEILNELNALGHKVSEAIHKIWDSEERKKAEAEIREALHLAGARIDQVAEEFRTSEFTKDLKLQADKVVDAVEESKVTQEVRKGLLQSLRRLNEELSGWLEREDERAAAGESGPAERADAPGQPETPAEP